MAMKSMTSSTDREQKPAHHSAGSARNLAAAELLSFLKQTRASGLISVVLRKNPISTLK